MNGLGQGRLAIRGVAVIEIRGVAVIEIRGVGVSSVALETRLGQEALAEEEREA